MAKVYITRCIVKKDKTTYPKGAVIEKLTEAEIKRGLAEHWLEEVGGGEPAQDAADEPAAVENSKPNSAKKNPKGTDQEALFNKDAGSNQ